MRRYGRLKGKLVKINFYDHSLEDSPDHEPCICEAFGIIHSQSSRLLLLQTWRVVNADKDSQEANKEVIKILKSCVVDIKVYDE